MKLPRLYDEIHPTEKRLVREAYIKQQGGACQQCGSPLAGKPAKSTMGKAVNNKLFPKGFFDYPVHLHHCHNTGMTIGAVHAHCNAVLWQYYGE